MKVIVERFRSAWNVRYFLIIADGKRFLRKSLACAKALKRALEHVDK